MKLIISLLFFILISCEQISKDEVINKIENTKDVIVKKTIKSADPPKELKNEVKEEKNNKDRIFP